MKDTNTQDQKNSNAIANQPFQKKGKGLSMAPPRAASLSIPVQREEEEEEEEEEEISGGGMDEMDFSDSAKKEKVAGGGMDVLAEGEETESTTASAGVVDQSKSSKSAMKGAGWAVQRITEADDTTVKEAMQFLAKAGAFGEAAKSRSLETSGGSTAEASGKASGSAGAEVEAMSGVVIDLIEGITYMASISAKAGVGFSLEGMAKVATEIGGIEMSASIKAKLSGFAGVMAEAGGKFNYSAAGIAMEGKAYAMAGAKSEGEITANVTVGDLGIDGNGKFEGMAGAEAGAEGKLSIGLDGITASGKAEAFAGAKVKASGKASVSFKGKLLISISGEVSASAGVGGEVEGEFSFSNGKLKIGGKLAATLGIGGGAGVTVEVDFKEIGNAIYNIIKDALNKKIIDRKSLADQDRPAMEADQDPEEVKKKLYGAVHPHIKAYGMKKEKAARTKGTFGGFKADHLAKLGKVQEIIDQKILLDNELSEMVKYKVSDAILADAIWDALQSQLTSRDGIIVQAGQIRAYPSKTMKAFREGS